MRAMQMLNPAPCAPLMNHLRPSMRQPSPSLAAMVESMAGSEPAPGRRLGHREAGPDLTRRKRPKVLLLLLLAGDHLEQVHVALIRGGAVQGQWPEQRVPGRLEDDRLSPNVQPTAAPLLRHVRREQSGVAGLLLQRSPKIVRRVMHDARHLLLHRDNNVADELARPGG